MPHPVKMDGTVHMAYYEADLKQQISFGGKKVPAEAEGKVREITTDHDMRDWLNQRLGVTACGKKTRLRKLAAETKLTCMSCQDETG